MTNAPAWDRGARGNLDEGKSMVTRGVDLVVTRNATSIKLNHRRRHAKALDRFLSAPDPWELAEPIDWSPFAMSWQEREHYGRELLAAGWCP